MYSRTRVLMASQLARMQIGVSAVDSSTNSTADPVHAHAIAQALNSGSQPARFPRTGSPELGHDRNPHPQSFSDSSEHHQAGPQRRPAGIAAPPPLPSPRTSHDQGTQPTSGSQVSSDSTGKPSWRSSMSPEQEEDADQGHEADQHGKRIHGDRPGLDLAPPGDDPPVGQRWQARSGCRRSCVASPVMPQRAGNPAANGRTNRKSYNSSKYHLFSRKQVDRPGTCARQPPPGCRWNSAT